MNEISILIKLCRHYCAMGTRLSAEEGLALLAELDRRGARVAEMEAERDEWDVAAMKVAKRAIAEKDKRVTELEMALLAIAEGRAGDVPSRFARAVLALELDNTLSTAPLNLDSVGDGVPSSIPTYSDREGNIREVGDSGLDDPAPDNKREKCPRCGWFIAHDGIGRECHDHDCYYSTRPSRYATR